MTPRGARSMAAMGCELLPEPGAIVSWACLSTYVECPR
jgi:hypothetical protein